MPHIVLYDDLSGRDIDYDNRIKEITEHFVWAPDGFKLQRTRNLTETLKNISSSVDKEDRWVLVNTYGHAIWEKPNNFYNAAVEQCKKENSPLMGHVLYRTDYHFPYPYLHNQCFILDVLAWRDVGFPQFEWLDNVNDNVNKLVRSVENFHDDYTPHWVGPDKTAEIVSLEYREFGSIVIEKFAEAGYRIINFDDELRGFKWHLYPNDNYDEMKSFFETGQSDKNGHLHYVLDKHVIWERDNLKSNAYVLNTEEIIINSDLDKKVKSPIDHYISVAGGFKTVLLTHVHGSHENTRISFVDISNAGLDFQRYIRQSWNGDLDTYWDCFENFKSLHPNYHYSWLPYIPWNTQIQNFLQEINLTKNDFKEIWNNYIKLECDYNKIDLLNETEALLNLIKETDYNNYYIWLSNAFDMTWTVFTYGSKSMNNKKETLLKELQNLNLNIAAELTNQLYIYNYGE